MAKRDDDLGFFTIYRTRHLRRHARDDNNITGSAEHQDPTDPHPKFPKLLLEAQNRGSCTRHASSGYGGYILEARILGYTGFIL